MEVPSKEARELFVILRQIVWDHGSLHEGEALYAIDKALTRPLPPAGEVEEMCELMREEAKQIREHVPDEDNAFCVIAQSASDPDRQTVAGPLHADVLDKAADMLTALSRENADLRKIMDAMCARHEAQMAAVTLLTTPTKGDADRG